MTISSISTLAAMQPAMPPIKKLDFKPTAGQTATLKNGMRVFFIEDSTNKIMHITALVNTGKVYDAKDKKGLGELTLDALSESGSKKYRSEYIDKTLDFLGASVQSVISTEEAQVSMNCLKKDFDKVLGIYADLMINPAFEEQKVNLIKSQEEEMIKRRNDSPIQAAMREGLRRFYGPEHPYGWRTEISDLQKLTVEDMKAYHDNYFKPNNVILAVSGDYGSRKELINKLDKAFGKWKKGEVSFPDIPEVKNGGRRHIYHIQKEIAQTFIVLLMKGPERLDDAEFPLLVTDNLLGGSLSSRMSAEIRSRKGLAYTVYCYFSKRNKGGFIMSYMGTKPQTYSQALEEMLRQFDIIKSEKASEEEVERSKSAITNSFVFRFETPFELISEKAGYAFYNYPEDYLQTYVDKINAVSPDDVKATADKWFDTDSAQIFVIGDSKKFDKPLSVFGEVTELTDED